jgi:dephospho-CoA kinase
MTPLQIKAVLARQMTDHDRRRLADVLIRTGLSRYNAQRQVRRLIARLRKVRGFAPEPPLGSGDPKPHFTRGAPL